MAQADGTILIDTEIDADGMKAGSEEVESAVRNMAKSVEGLGTKAKTALNRQVDSFITLNRETAAQEKRIDTLKKKVAEYGKQKIPTEEYSKLQNQLDDLSSKYDEIDAKKREWEDLGFSEKDSLAMKELSNQLEDISQEMGEIIAKQEQLKASGMAFKDPLKTDKAIADIERLEAAGRKYDDMERRLKTSFASIEGQVNEYKSSLLKADSAQNKTNKSSKKLSKSLKDTGKAAKSASFGLGKMLGTSILFSFAFQAINTALTGIKEGFTNLAQYSGTTNNSISMLWSSLERLKNSLATAFAPILDVVAPILSKFIDMISTAASYVSMFFAFLSGKSTYTRAVAVQKDYAASLEDTAVGASDAAKETEAAAAAAEDYLSPLDDINKYTDQSSGGGSGAGSGGVGENTGPLFEEVEITDIPILEKVKEILSDLFKPFKEAWAAEGKATIEAAKYAFSGLGELAKSVGKSFLKVWTNGTGTQMLSNMLQIAQNLLGFVGNIATKLNEAWNTNNLGTQIIQNLFNLFNSVLGVVERISAITQEWTLSLDFTPLLEGFNNFTTQLSPLIDSIGEMLIWLHEQVVLPLATLVLENVLPGILNVLGKLFELLTIIIDWINQNVLPIVEPILSGLLEAVDACFGGVFDILSGILDFIIGIFTGDWDRAFSGLGTIAEGLSTVVDNVFGFIQDSILNPFDNFLQGVFATDFTESFGIFGEVLNGFFGVVKDIWDSIKKIFDGIIDFITGVFSGNWEKAWNGIKDIFGGIWDLLVTIVKTPINLIIGAINGLIAGVCGGLNAVIGLLNNIHFTIPDWVPVFGGSSFGFNIPKLTAPQIPYLASGAVIPPNREFMAVLGDQKHGNNIEAPESLIRRIVREETGNSSIGRIEIPLYLDGKKIAYAVVDEAKLMRMRTGKNPFELA